MDRAEERDKSRRATFIVRVSHGADGRISGVIERVRSGEKVRVDTLADVEKVLVAMLARDEQQG